jgi:hypothetical protein
MATPGYIWVDSVDTFLHYIDALGSNRYLNGGVACVTVCVGYNVTVDLVANGGDNSNFDATVDANDFTSDDSIVDVSALNGYCTSYNGLLHTVDHGIDYNINQSINYPGHQALNQTGDFASYKADYSP